ncbi:SEC-C motif domain protein [Nitrosomonas sp. Is79A3]|uniref:SEC-C metal-binding domain-containing protein n=1 Tax=Nitrosomonas sp. (strain Is79A3) TaxID=261292 RepID=UPI000215CD65
MPRTTPPADVLRQLRSEVGFGCPHPGCGNPYLEWHHFDPPYREEAHHRPEGMIALCAEHHKKADAGAYTKDQLRSFKLNRANAELVKGSFDWLRNDLLAVVGGNYYYDTPVAIEIDGNRVVWFRRDEEGYLRLNVKVLSLSPEPRASIVDNIWGEVGGPEDLRSPPGGKSLLIKYSSGDRLSVEFQEFPSAEALFARYRSDLLRNPLLKFPLTTVEVNFAVGSTELLLSPKGTTLPGNNRIIGGLSVRGGTGVSVGVGFPWRQNSAISSVPRFRRNAMCPCKSGLRYKSCHGIVR